MRALGWPQNLSQRVRWAAAAFAIAAPLSNLVFGTSAARSSAWAAVTIVCCLTLTALWIDIYRREGPSWWTDPVEAVAIFLMAMATMTPFTTLGLVYAGLNHGSLYRSTRRVLLRFAMFTGAFFVALNLSPAAVPELLVLVVELLLDALPVDPERRIRDHVVEALPCELVVTEAVPEADP